MEVRDILMLPQNQGEVLVGILHVDHCAHIDYTEQFKRIRY